jgi:hypothetical protein
MKVYDKMFRSETFMTCLFDPISTLTIDFLFLYVLNLDGLVKSPKTVMPDLIRHPEVIGFTGFRLSPE